MNSFRLSRSVCLTLLLIGSTACSTIKSWFPDKERDYQFTAEIAEIVVPDDLKAGGLSLSAPRPSAAVASETTNVEAVNNSSKPAEDEAPRKPARAEPAADAAVASSTAPGSSLQIDQSQTQAAHIVAKALSRQQLEITERNIEKGYFYVKFDPNAVTVEDKSWLDELNFVFGDEPSQEREYRIRLQEINPQLTEVTVQDSEGKTQSSNAANALLKLITDAINQDISSQDAPKNADTNGEAKSEH